MLIASFSWLKSERFWRVAITFLFFLGFLGGVIMGSLLIYPPPPGSFGCEGVPVKQEKTEVVEPLYDAVLTGAFSLDQGSSSKFFPLIIDEVQLLGVNTRPGHKDANKILFKLKSSGEELVVTQGSPFFLKIEEQAEGRTRVVGFSKERLGLQLIPVAIRQGGSLVEMGVSPSNTDSPSIERGEVMVERSALNPLNEQTYFREIQDAKWWGVDELIRHYGGSEYELKKECQKLEVVGEGGSTYSFVSVGDFLVWDEGQWKEMTPGSISEKKPIAQVNQIMGHLMEVTVWDESGFNSARIKLVPQGTAKTPLSLDSLPSAIRLRNDSQISCVLNKRRLLLKEGDWVLRTAHGWRILKTTGEIEEFLAHKLQGELFIFDQLDKQSGKMVVLGHYFDAMRTQMQQISVPVVSERQSSKKKTRKIYKKSQEKVQASEKISVKAGL